MQCDPSPSIGIREVVDEYSEDHGEKAKCVVDQAQVWQAKENMKQKVGMRFNVGMET